MYALEDAAKTKELEMQRHGEETPEPPMGMEEEKGEIEEILVPRMEEKYEIFMR